MPAKHQTDLTQQDRATAIDRDFVNHPADREDHPLPVVGEKRVYGLLGARQFGDVRLIQSSREQLIRPTRNVAHVHQSRSIGRDHDAANCRDRERG
jgi:hypothetical protein